MDVPEYLATLRGLELDYERHLPTEVWELFGRRWFRETAPSKTESYGTEAWQRMGSLGILAELSGCHYRCRRFVQRGAKMSRGLGSELAPGEFYDPVYDALLDSFGYSVMLRVCVDIEMGMGMPVPFDWRIALDWGDPVQDNEALLRTYWDARDPIDSVAAPVALRSALNSWRLLT